MGGGVVSRQQAQNYAEMLIAYEDFTASPSAYDGHYRSLFENLGADFERGLQTFVREADLGDADDVAEFLEGLNALEVHVVDSVKLEDALEKYGSGEEMAGDLDRYQVIADTLTPPERIIDAREGYSTDEIATLHEFMFEQEAQ